MKRINNFPVLPGIYVIKNKINNKIYIGSASNLKSRRNRHLFDLENNKHHSSHLQKAYNKYGEENFEFSILELINDDTDRNKLKNALIINEQKYIDLYTPYNSEIGYNINDKANSRLGVKCSEETKDKLRVAMNKKKKYLSNLMHSEKYQIILRDASLGKNNYMYSKTHTLEARKKISESRENYKGKNSSMYGKTHSDETKKKIGLKSIGRNAKKIIVFDLDNKLLFECPTVRNAEILTGVWHYNIKKCTSGEIDNIKGYIFKYNTE